MPSKKIIRNFKPGSYYYIYNHGLDNEEVFLEEDDFETFLSYLKIYLLPLEETLTSNPNLPKRLHNKSLSSQLELLGFCLLPANFQLLLKPIEKNSISKLLKQLTNAYTYYFNKKYKRRGPLFHGRFKTIQIEPSELMELIRYLHFNPTISWLVGSPKDYAWSSYNEYLKGDSKLVFTRNILSKFPSLKDFEKFILNQKEREANKFKIRHIISNFRG